MNAHEEIKAGSIVLVGVFSAILIFVLIVALQALFLHAQEDEAYDKVTSVQDEGLRGLQAQQLAVLHGYRWIDRKKGVVGIPIERAMERIIEEKGAED
jgi:hypothetical protein